METDTGAEFARLDRVECELRRLGALNDATQADLALARQLAWERAAATVSHREPPKTMPIRFAS